MSLLKAIITIGFLVMVLKGNGQCNYINNTFQANELVTYEVYYNWGFIWLNAGSVSFKTEALKYKSEDALRLSSVGSTYQNYDWLYKVRDKFESIIYPTSIKPLYFLKETKEGGYDVNNEYTFIYPGVEIISKTKNNKSPLKIDTLKSNKCVFDVLSIIYACRTIHFSHKKINDTIPLNTIIDAEIYELYIRYLGKEKIINHDKRMFNCNVFSVKMVEGTIFKGDKEMKVWVSDDKNQIPVYVEAHILVGTIKAFVNEIKGTKWPANYHIFAPND